MHSIQPALIFFYSTQKTIDNIISLFYFSLVIFSLVLSNTKKVLLL